MLFTTTTQFAALALCLIAGWFLGLASHSGGRKWKTRYAAEREAHADYRKQHDTALADANRRIGELEHENARLAKAAETASTTVTAPTLSDRVTGRNTTTRVVRTADPADRRPGWFDFGNRPRV